MSVCTHPGQKQATRTPEGPRSNDRVFVIMFSAAWNLQQYHKWGPVQLWYTSSFIKDNVKQPRQCVYIAIGHTFRLSWIMMFWGTFGPHNCLQLPQMTVPHMTDGIRHILLIRKICWDDYLIGRARRLYEYKNIHSDIPLVVQKYPKVQNRVNLSIKILATYEAKSVTVNQQNNIQHVIFLKDSVLVEI